MKRITLTFLALACCLFGCQQAELIDPNDNGAVQMKTVTISAGIDNTDTKASLDSKTGAFTWQSGDMISVLATDGNFYDFILEGEFGAKKAEFVGNIPASANVTTVATYPRIVADGTANTVLTGNTLNYVLPATWKYAKDVSNVPMVATFGEGADYMSFKQVGGVMRFPVRNLPREAQFVVRMNDKTITGQFPVDITALGETCMAAGTAASELVINYTSDVDGAYAEFNVPVPTGVYNNFTVTIKDTEGNELFAKNYSAENKVERATLLNMKELVLPERPMAISEVWPFFVDARVVFAKYEGVEKYAFYIDGSEEPVIKDAEDLDDMAGALIGGTFGHNTTHTVAVAKVVDGVPVIESKSAIIEFTTADVYQLTNNTGTKFVTVGWDDVAIQNGTKFENGKWNLVPKLSDKDGYKGHQRRGYMVQLLAADKTTVIYDMIPFDGHAAFTNVFSDSSWLGKINGENICIPTALAFGYLEPDTDYYFRVKTLDEPVAMTNDNGNYNSPLNEDQPYPYILFSERGGCAWSDLVKVSTDSPHVPSDNELLFEDFNDIMVANDYMNWAPGVVPDLYSSGPVDWDTYSSAHMKDYPKFLEQSANERKWTTQAFSKVVRCYELGLQDVEYAKETDMTFNANAGSLNGWTWWSKKNTYGIFPIFGAMRLGQTNGTGNNGALLKTPVLNSDKLFDHVGTKCIITFKLAYSSGAIAPNAIPRNIWVQHFRGSGYISEYNLGLETLHPEEYKSNVTAHHSDDKNYAHYQHYYEMSCELYLRKGDQVGFLKPTNSSCKGTLVIDDIMIKVVPGEYDENTFVDDGIATEPDNTNYDVFGLGEFPISFWWTVPTSFHNYDQEKTIEAYKKIAESGMNIVLYNSYPLDCSVAENKRIMEISSDLGMKFIGQVTSDENHPYGFPSNADRIAAIKENFGTSDAYIGEYLIDEPKATAYDNLASFVNDYLSELPDKEPYINLYPDYAADFGTISYESYIQEYLDKVQTKSLSYDYYGLNKSELNRSYYSNLDLVRSKTLENKKPFWVITQAGAVGVCLQPTEEQQRWTVWSTIASGSKGISYFCYWTPSDHEKYMVDEYGKTTENYDYVKKINSDIYTIGTKLIHCHADGSIHSSTNAYPLYDNAGAGRTKYGPVERVSSPNTSVICGCFRDARISENGDNYKGHKVMLVSRFASRVKIAKAELTLAASVNKITVTHCNTVKEVDLVSNMSPVSVGSLVVKYLNNVLTVEIPDGEAALVEF